MSEPPKPWAEMIERTEIMEIANCNGNEMSYVSVNGINNFPKSIYVGASRKRYYDRKEMLSWLDKNNIRDIFKNRPAPSIMSDKFNNAAAVKFISRKPITDPDSPINKHCSGGTTTTIHLEERNDYVPPHSGLVESFYSFNYG